MQDDLTKDEQEQQSRPNVPPSGSAGSEPQRAKGQPTAIPSDEVVSAGAIDEAVEQEMLKELAQAEVGDVLGEASSSELLPDGEGQVSARTHPAARDVPTVKPVEFDQFERTEAGGQPRNIDLLLDVTLPISIELGRTEMTIHDILELGSGSVVELNKLAGEPVDLLVNNKVIARGEVVVIDENFGLRVTSLVSPEERLKSL